MKKFFLVLTGAGVLGGIYYFWKSEQKKKFLTETVPQIKTMIQTRQNMKGAYLRQTADAAIAKAASDADASAASIAAENAARDKRLAIFGGTYSESASGNIPSSSGEPAGPVSAPAGVVPGSQLWENS